jgi:hypothetical protein
MNMLIYTLIAVGIFVAFIAISILISRANYQKQIVKTKLSAQTDKLKINETYWYNSAKGFAMDEYPSSWAKVLSEPRTFGKNQIVVDVLLRVGKKKIETTVPADSLAQIVKVNS